MFPIYTPVHNIWFNFPNTYYDIILCSFISIDVSLRESKNQNCPTQYSWRRMQKMHKTKIRFAGKIKQAFYLEHNESSEYKLKMEFTFTICFANVCNLDLISTILKSLYWRNFMNTFWSITLHHIVFDYQCNIQLIVYLIQIYF